MMKKKAHTIFRIVLLTSTAISLFFVPWSIVWAWIVPLPNSVQEQVEEALDRGFDGIIVYVDKAGEPPKTYTAGWHDWDHTIPARKDALFKIASVSKLYHAVAIAKLAEAKQLSLDNTLADYFPELVGRIEYANEITLRMMVQHRSGIPNYTDTYNYWANPKETSEENLALILDQPATFKPGKGYEYSNTNYLLLSELIKKVTGESEFHYFKREILNPLKLKNTFASINDVDLDDVMSGRYEGYNTDLKTDDQGMVATAQDVGKFLRALNDGSVFKGGEREIYASIYVFNHTGLVPGYQTIAKYDEDMDAVIVQFTNTTNFKGYNWNISEVIYNRIVKLVRRGHTE